MITRKELQQELQALLGIEQEVLDLCARQLNNPSFFSGIALHERPEVQTGLETFQSRSEQCRQTLEKLIAAIRAERRDVY